MNERGAVSVFVAILVIVIFGFTALAVDAARAFEERRELQRTADVSALSGAQDLRNGEAIAEATGVYYVDQNPTGHHPGTYNTVTGDLVDAYLRSSSATPPESCVIGGTTYDCVYSKVVAPPKSSDPAGFEWLFAKVLGFDETSIAADATAVLGSGGPGGDKLVPWLVLDCPTPQWEGSDFAAATAAVQLYTGCPYTFNDDYSDSAARENLYIDTAGATGGNFHAAALNFEPDCPATPDGRFDHSGGSVYEEILSGLADARVPCHVGKGARVYPKTGIMVGPTNHGLDARGVDGCMNEDSFHATVEVGTVGDGEVAIKDHSSPCLLALLLIVNPNDTHPELELDVPGGGRIAEFQHPQAVDNDGDGKWRFASPSGGSSKPYVVRRFAFFYLTDRGGPHNPYRGLFLKALDSANAVLDGAYDPDNGIAVVKLVA